MARFSTDAPCRTARGARCRSGPGGLLPESWSAWYGTPGRPMRPERTTAKTKTYTPGQIVRLLRQVEGGPSEGKTVEETCRALGVGESTYHRRRNQREGSRGVTGAMEARLRRGAAARLAGARRPDRSNRNSQATWTKKRG